MAKKTAGARLEAELYKRLERVAQVDRRSVSNVIEICILQYLPKLEAEILHDAPSDQPVPAAKPVRYPALRTTAKK